MLLTVLTSHNFTTPLVSQDATVSPYTKTSDRDSEVVRDRMHLQTECCLIAWMGMADEGMFGETLRMDHPVKAIGHLRRSAYRSSIPKHQGFVDGTGQNDVREHQQFC